MTTLEKKLSLSSKGLRYKLKISFCLMSILPLLVSLYLVSNYILPYVGFRLDILVSIALSLFIAIVGLLVLRDIFDHMLSISAEAKRVISSGGNLELDTSRDDEIGELSRALNQLTHRVRTEMDELTRYSEKTTKINLDVQKHVAVVSNLLQVSYLISQDAKLDDVIKLIVEKANVLSDSEVALLLFKSESEESFLVREAVGKGSEELLKVCIGSTDALFDIFAKTNKAILMDQGNSLDTDLVNVLARTFKYKNAMFLPVYIKGKARAWLGVARSEDNIAYQPIDMRFLDAFAKLASIAIENDMLVRRLEKLEVKDSLTGLYNEAFIRNRIQEEIKRAFLYQRPCALIVLAINQFGLFREHFGSLQSEMILKKLATMIRESVTEVDRVGRTQDSEFAIVLPEKNKRQAQRLAEEIKKNIESIFSQEQETQKRLTVQIGVSENPLDGVEAQELMHKARESIKVVT